MRIVSLCPSLTELVCLLGREAWLVGRTKFCVAPESVASLPVVGGTKDPRLERICQLTPDLVLFNEEENRLEDLKQLEQAGLRCVHFFPRTLPQTLDLVEQLGHLLDAQAAAQAIMTDILQAQQEALSRASSLHPPSFVYLIWRKPYMTLTEDTYISAVLEAAGGINLVRGAAFEGTRYPVLTLEALKTLNPQWVLLSSEPFPFQPKHVQELMTLTSYPAERFRLVDGAALSWHGSRTAEGIRYAMRVLSGAALSTDLGGALTPASHEA